MRDFISMSRQTLRVFPFRGKVRALSVSAIFFLFLLPVNGLAQQREALRDSLKKATEALEYHPDSVDLRLKKAAWNLQQILIIKSGKIVSPQFLIGESPIIQGGDVALILAQHPIVFVFSILPLL
jgi:hypothetical protein